MVFEKTDILLPKIKDYRKWAVVACDQFTSQPESGKMCKNMSEMKYLHII